MSETLTITKENAMNAYKEATSKGKTLLENLFGKNIFSGKITDRVKTFEDACRELRITPESVYGRFSVGVTDSTQKSLYAFAQLQIICRALNEGWQPNWNNSSEYKYYAWFDMRAGSGFSYNAYDCACTLTNVGSRLCFKSEALAKYAGTQFLSIYKEYMNL